MTQLHVKEHTTEPNFSRGSAPIRVSLYIPLLCILVSHYFSVTTNQTHILLPNRKAIINLEDVGEVSEVEDIVELNGSGQECLGDPAVQCQSSLDHLSGEPLHRAKEAGEGQMLRQDAGVDSRQGFLVGEADGEHSKVALWNVK